MQFSGIACAFRGTVNVLAFPQEFPTKILKKSYTNQYGVYIAYSSCRKEDSSDHAKSRYLLSLCCNARIHGSQSIPVLSHSLHRWSCCRRTLFQSRRASHRDLSSSSIQTAHWCRIDPTMDTHLSAAMLLSDRVQTSSNSGSYRISVWRTSFMRWKFCMHNLTFPSRHRLRSSALRVSTTASGRE